ncbi:hypothetical protein JIQ42_06033 [Leishmania sp. Namibia]|uniref:hypothetical protein n=1 Tax=Leishmania sp. Namibia TaxID=2802991 RepID=UPI001B63FB61|nr:hypothetical protein JIQ42_06033 [Leishmania sp. Namibia]
MASPSTASSPSAAEHDFIIPIETRYMYVTARSVPRETLLMTGDCPICKSALGQPCVKCTSSMDECSVVVGVCSHIFHLHCLEQWLQGTCPLCRNQWQQERIIQQS